jgi:DNA-directed RNA polymerase specialized sigma24 family protein
MPDAEQDSSVDHAAIYALCAKLLRQNNWQLLEAADLARRISALLHDQHWNARGPAPAGHDPATRRKHIDDPITAAALRSYAEVLYAAFAGHAGEDRQRRAYAELLRYISRVLYRSAPSLSRDERDELTYEIVAELYYRLPPGLQVLPHRIVRVPGAFIAIALQETRNALHRWQHAARHWQHTAVAADDKAMAIGDGEPPARGGTEDDLAAQVERSERSVQIRGCFVRALQRYPRARLQLHVVWLHIVEEQDYATIARTLGMSVENVRVLYSRGRTRLRRDSEWLSLAIEECLPAALHIVKVSTRSAEFQRGQDHD